MLCPLQVISWCGFIQTRPKTQKKIPDGSDAEKSFYLTAPQLYCVKVPKGAKKGALPQVRDTRNKDSVNGGADQVQAVGGARRRVARNQGSAMIERRGLATPPVYFLLFCVFWVLHVPVRLTRASDGSSSRSPPSAGPPRSVPLASTHAARGSSAITLVLPVLLAYDIGYMEERGGAGSSPHLPPPPPLRGHKPPLRYSHVGYHQHPPLPQAPRQPITTTHPTPPITTTNPSTPPTARWRRKGKSGSCNPSRPRRRAAKNT